MPAMRLLGAALALSLIDPQSAASEQKPKAPPPQVDIVATLGDKTITEAQLEGWAKERLARIRSQEYSIKRQVLEEHIARALLEKEASVRGISVDDLEKREIHDKVAPLTEEQKRAAYETNVRRYQGKSEADALAQIEVDLKRFRVKQARSRLLGTLREKTPVKILLEPPRIQVAAGDGPATGPRDAPVTILEFSDFQCPACARASPTLRRVLQQYRGKVRLLFRDYPLPMHPQAPKAAEAAACANEQGKFWEMHDQLFDNQDALLVPDLKRHAAELGLEKSKFETCLDSGKHASSWKASIDAARKLGVNATPTFFINGRMLSGAQSYQTFADIVEQELERGAARTAQ